MEQIKLKLRQMMEKLEVFIKRFPISFSYLVAITCVAIYQIIVENETVELMIALTACTN